MLFLIYLLSVALVLGVLVFVHEFGHYAVAKLCGVRVEAFSLGFGKRLVGFQRGGTDYRISLLPIGGYVKMAGESPMESRTGDPGEFMSHPRWQRFLIAIAGPAMNILLAIVILTGVYMVHYEYPAFLEQPAEVGEVVAGSPAEKAGIQPGDRIVLLEDLRNPTWEQVYHQVILNPNQPLEVTVQRGGQTLALKVVPQASGTERLGEAGWLPSENFVVEKVEKGLPAEKMGIKPGDQIESMLVGNNAVRTTWGLIQALQQTKGGLVRITVVRESQRLNFVLQPEFTGDESGEKRYRVGMLAPSPMTVEHLPLNSAFHKAVDSCKSNSLLIFELMGKLLQHTVSVKALSSPIGIARASGEAAMQKGWTPLLTLMAGISVNLAIFNLLPIPILDGGLMLLLLVESVMRRDIKQEVKERVYQAAFVFLLLFAAVVIYNDVAKLPGFSRYLP